MLDVWLINLEANNSVIQLPASPGGDGRLQEESAVTAYTATDVTGQCHLPLTRSIYTKCWPDRGYTWSSKIIDGLQY